jgi:dihydroflavonol-4-reductase
VKAFVTGGTGFLGGVLIRELVADGVPVRALVRAGSDARGLDGLPVERAEGDLRDRGSLHAAMEGCDTLFHLAAFYSTREEHGPLMYEINVVGTRNVLQVASALRYARAVHTSTIGTIGRPPDGSLPNEDVEFNLWETCSHYVRSKYLAELLALNMAQDGLPVVLVNPTSPVGAGDVKPSSSGKRILHALSGRVPSFPPGGLNLVAARDVARGHILAAQKGQIGRRYILGGTEGNLTLQEFLRLLAEAAGAPVAQPAKESPFRVVSRALKKPAPRKGHLPAALTCDCRRAAEQLGMPQTPLRQALAEAVEWFRGNGYLKQGTGGSL